MRPQTRGPLDSLYFTYPQFDPPQDRKGLNAPTAVLIVGAGPIGMTAALALAKEGVASVLIDRKATFNDGSRAICIARSSFQIFKRIGVVQPFLDKALDWTTGRSFYRGEQILEFEMPDGPDEKYRPMYNLQQQYIEQFLWQAIEREPLIEARWQTEIAEIADIPSGVRAVLKDPSGCYEIEAAWLLAADGARSTVRGLRGKRLKGENFEGRYVIADVQMAHDYPTIRRALFDPACRPGGTVLVHKQPDDIWRIDYQLTADEDAAEAVREETVRASVAAVLKDLNYAGPWELEWWSVYSANTLALDNYRDERVIFIGDSAHIVPIFGVRGLNNGLADAANIAWKLGWVLGGKAPPGLLDSYSPERRGATLDVFANAGKSARFMTPPTPGWTLMRDAALSLALSEPWAGQLANPRQMTPYTYSDSPWVSPDDPGFETGPKPGAALPEMRLNGGFLSDRLGPGFSLLTVGAPMDWAADHPELCEVILPPDSAAAAMLGARPGSAYLIRPDGHITARARNATRAGLQAAFARATGNAPTPGGSQ